MRSDSADFIDFDKEEPGVTSLDMANYSPGTLKQKLGVYEFSDDIKNLVKFLDHLVHEGGRAGCRNTLFQKRAHDKKLDMAA